MRIVPVALALGLAAALACALTAAAGPPAVGSTHYLVQVDPRLCPSPLCGGYWVRLANRRQTRCSNGALQPRCYVAQAVDEQRHPLAAPLTEGALARALIEPRSYGGAGELGVLVIADIRLPTGRDTELPIFRVRDTGIRCVRAPCFFMRARRLSASRVVTVSELDLSAAGVAPTQRRSAEAALQSTNGLFLAGRVERASDGGRSLRALRVYLKP